MARPRTAARRPQTDLADIRHRIDAVTGKAELSQKDALASLQPLIRKFEAQASERDRIEKEFRDRHKALARLRGPAPKAAPEQAAALKAHRAAITRLGRTVKSTPPKVTAVEPLIKSGSIITVDGPPYGAR